MVATTAAGTGMAAAFAAACGGDDKDSSSGASGSGSQAAATSVGGSPVAAQIKRGGALSGNVGTGDQQQLDPMLEFNSILMSRGSGIAYSRLLRTKIGPDISTLSSVVEGDLAASWEQVDPTTAIFTISPEAKWQNIAPVSGRAVTAEDIAYSYTRQRDLKFTAGTIVNLESWQAVDPKTLRVKLKQPDADGLLSLTSTYNKVVAREAVELKGDLKSGPTIGSGPWILREWTQNQVTKFDRNPDYWKKDAASGTLPYADHLQLFRLGDASTALAAFRSKQIQLHWTPPYGGLTQEDIDRLKREIPGLGLAIERGYTGMHTFLQADITPTSDPRVRQAISKIIDRQAIMDAVQGRGSFSAGLVLPDEDVALPDEELKKLMPRDLAGAKQLAQAAGFTGWNTTMGFYANPDSQTSAELVQANLKEIGIQTTLQPWDAGRLNRYWVEQNTEIVTSPRQTGGSPNADTVQYFRSTGDRNLSHIKDPELDALIDAQFAELDKGKRKAILQQIQRKVLERASPLTVYGNVSTAVYHPFVKNYYRGGFGQGTGWDFMWLDQ